MTGTDGTATGTATLNLVAGPVLTSSPNPSQFGQTVTFSATFPGGITPPGAAYVSFDFPAGALATSGVGVVAPIATPITSFTTGSNTILQPGSWAVTARFLAADPNIQIGPTSNTVTQVVNAVAPVLSTSPNPSQFGQAVTFSATIPGGITPPGTKLVGFNIPSGAFANGTIFVTVPITNPTTTISTAAIGVLEPGSWSFTAAFLAADPNIQIGPTSNTVTQVVNPPPLDHLVLSPATATVDAGVSQAYRAEGLAANGNDLGDKTTATTFTISPDGSCSGATCTPARPGPHTVTGRDGSATGTATLNVAVARAELSIAISAPTFARSGATATYQITVSNQGPDPASSVHAGLLIPAGATISTISPGGSVSGQFVTWSAGTLAANQTTAFEVTVQIG